MIRFMKIVEPIQRPVSRSLRCQYQIPVDVRQESAQLTTPSAGLLLLELIYLFKSESICSYSALENSLCSIPGVSTASAASPGCKEGHPRPKPLTIVSCVSGMLVLSPDLLALFSICSSKPSYTPCHYIHIAM